MADEDEVTPESFHCAQCGVCCATQKVVLLTLPDIFRLAGQLGVRPGTFYKRYCLKSDRFNDRGLTRVYLKTGGGCPFLKDRRCSVHAFKPIVCSQSPFYYLEASLAALKVTGVIVPGCGIERRPYGTVTRGDRDRLVDMEIEVGATDEYMQQHGRFDENSAQGYLTQIQALQADGVSRALVHHRLLDESIRREDFYRNDPYYRGSTGMYLSGFYGEFREEAARLAREHRGLLTFEPAAVGTAGGDVIVVLHGEDYKNARARLEGKTGGVIARASAHSGFEYAAVTITIDKAPAAFFYYYVESRLKPAIKSPPGMVTFTFTDGGEKRFGFTGDDTRGWLG